MTQISPTAWNSTGPSARDERALRIGHRRAAVTDGMLGEIAPVYRDHFDEGPWQAIQDRFSVSESTPV